jgi:hypothetical protein
MVEKIAGKSPVKFTGRLFAIKHYGQKSTAYCPTVVGKNTRKTELFLKHHTA